METTMNPNSTNPNSTANLDRGKAQDQNLVDRTASAAHGTVDKVAAAATPAIDRLAAGAHQVVDKVAGAAGSAAEMAATKGGQLRAQQEQLFESCRGYVRDNPLTALGIAVAAGFVLSRVLSNR